jgi:hypothetical protein
MNGSLLPPEVAAGVSETGNSPAFVRPAFDGSLAQFEMAGRR